jgi:hypothetical protein
MTQVSDKPALNAVQRPGQNGFKYRPKFGLVVVCKDEAHQQVLFKRLTKLALKVKVVCV